MAADQPAGRQWNLNDIVTIPEVTEIKLGKDSKSAVYVTRSADLLANQDRSSLSLVDLSTGTQRLLLRAKTIEQVAQFPGTFDWSALLDIGEGVQLYRIDQNGKITPLVLNPATILEGEADHALPSFEHQAPRRVGILSYKWSPDGRWLWYSVVKKLDGAQEVVFDEAAGANRGKRRLSVKASIDFYLRTPAGKDIHVSSRPTTDVLARYYGARVTWEADKVRFRIGDIDTNGRPIYRNIIWNLLEQREEEKEEPSFDPIPFPMQGPHGGIVTTGGYGKTRDLFEVKQNGDRHAYGKVAFTAGDLRSAGSWRAQDGKSALISTRYIERPRYGLALIQRDVVRELSSAHSLTRCDFDGDLIVGVCVREGQTTPHELVIVKPRESRVTELAPVSPSHDEIAPLRITSKTWVNRLGYWATGQIIWPRKYKKGTSYPAIIITHGSDADERFGSADLQWNYPAQLFAERGYIVLLMNDPSAHQNERIAQAYRQWGDEQGELNSPEMQKLLYLNGIYSMEDAVSELSASGDVDISRVGIAGYSRGAQIVNVAMTQSKMFRAASSGDGAYLEPSTYMISRGSFDTIFGGSPYGPNLKNYEALSPSLRASQLCGAMLFQMAAPYDSALDLYTMLREKSAAVQLSLYPGEDQTSDETHIFHIPNNRLLAMRENLAWFDFWLLGKVDNDAPHRERVKQWQIASQKGSPGCAATTEPRE